MRDRTQGHRVRKRPKRELIELCFDAVVEVGWPTLNRTIAQLGERHDVKSQLWNELPRMDFAWLGFNLTTHSFGELAEFISIAEGTARLDFRHASWQGWTEKRVAEAEWVQREFGGGLLWLPL